MRATWFWVVMGLCVAGSSFATVIMPRWPERRPVREWPLQFESEKVRVEIRDEVAEVLISHVVKNTGHQHLEAEYLYPIPPDAAVRDFAVELDGKRLDAELLDANKAEKIYQNIVRTMKDPGLLTYHDSNFLRVRALSRVRFLPSSGRRPGSSSSPCSTRSGVRAPTLGWRPPPTPKSSVGTSERLTREHRVGARPDRRAGAIRTA